jgi:hypothetical protein
MPASLHLQSNLVPAGITDPGYNRSARPAVGPYQIGSIFALHKL